MWHPALPGCQDVNGPIPSVFLDKLTAKIIALIHTATLLSILGSRPEKKYICPPFVLWQLSSYGLPLYFRIGFRRTP